jgi:hypothetical protein
MLVFKENVYGFVYDSQFGTVTEVYNKPLTEREIFLINNVLDEDVCLFTDIEDCNEMFNFVSKFDLECDEEGLNKVFEFIN